MDRGEVYGALEALDASLEVVRRKLGLLFAAFIILLVTFFVLVAEPALVSVKAHVLSQVQGVKVIQWTPTEFLIYKVKFSAVLALVAMSPILARYVWLGVKENLGVDPDLNLSPGSTVAVAALSLSLFVGGVVYAYILMLPLMMRFLVMLTPPDIAITYHMSGFFNFVALLVLAFGVVFELPLALNLAVRSGLVSYDTLSARRREAYVGIVVIGAMLTPPDIVSQAIMAAPLVLFYEIGLLTLRLSHSPSPETLAS